MLPDENLGEAEEAAVWAIVLAMVIFVALYLSVGAFWMVFYEERTWLEGYHFAVVTMTTVGFGHITPATEGGRVFIIFYIVIGLHLVAIMAGLMSAQLMSVELAQQRALAKEKKFRRTKHFSMLRHAWEALATHVGVMVLLTAVGASMFMILEDLPFVDSVYFAVETLSSVGYGDVYQDDPDWSVSSDIVLMVWMLLGVTTFALSIGKILLDVHQIAMARKIMALVETGVDEEDLEAMKFGNFNGFAYLSPQAPDSLEKEKETGSATITRERFLLYMYTKLQMVAPENVQAMNELFDGLDKSHTGTLTEEDLVHRHLRALETGHR